MPPRDVTVDVWTPDELVEFVSASADDGLAAVWRLAAPTGLRRSEVCGLQWPDIDLDAGRLSVRRAAVIVDGRVVVKPPKTAKSRRTVDLGAGTVAALKAWKMGQLEERLRAGQAWEPGQWVATDELGRPVNPDWLGRRFQHLAASVGLRPIATKQLRHSHATALLAGGEALKVCRNASAIRASK